MASTLIHVNGNGKSHKKVAINQEKVFAKLTRMTTNLLLSRVDALAGAGLDPVGRNFDKECGYIEGEPTIEQYDEFYQRVGVARRAIQILPDECFSIPPDIYELEDSRKTAWERRLKEIVEKHDPAQYWHRVDEQCGIGRFGALMVGINDRRDPKLPIKGINKDGIRTAPTPSVLSEILYHRVFSEKNIEIVSVEKDRFSPRYGQPTMYRFRFTGKQDTQNLISEEAGEAQVEPMDVHWSRVIHVADNIGESEIYGTPRLKPIINDLRDLRKIAGGSAEMFYKGGFPGISFETLPELVATGELDMESVKAEIEAYANGLQRYLRLIGMSAKSLAPQVADPEKHLSSRLMLICTAIKTPMKIFTGSEAGHLATGEDKVMWRDRIQGRNNKHCSPRIVRPYHERLQLMNVMPQVKSFVIKWKDLSTLSEGDKAKVALQRAQAILQYITSRSSVMIRPKHFFVYVMSFTEAEAEAIIDAAGGEEKMIAEMKKMQAMANAGKTPNTKGTTPQRKTGASGSKNGLGKNRKKLGR